MLLYMGQVLLDKIDLDKKLGVLSPFLAAFPSDPNPEELSLFNILKRQEAIMLDYSNILGERLAANPPPVGCKIHK